jgi:predicted RNA-binding protein with PIN domain
VPADRPATRWLVDGMNVIGARPDGWWRDRRAAMRRLTEALERFASETGEPVTVVFDGRPHDIPADRVDVRFAARRGPDAADDDIAALAAADADPASLRIVTSDAALAERGRAAGSDVVGAGAFRRRLDEVAGGAGGEEGGGGARRTGA